MNNKQLEKNVYRMNNHLSESFDEVELLFNDLVAEIVFLEDQIGKYQDTITERNNFIEELNDKIVELEKNQED
jgi:hypothetical protein